MNPRRHHGGWIVVLASIPLLAGCAVGQRPGKGQVLYRVEPGSQGAYYLYLPVGYDEEARSGNTFPLVMTFHGMKPFDNAGSQIREWQQEADRYGYVVCAPLLSTPDLLSPLPLDIVTPSLDRDEARILAIMDELARTTNIDPGAVLSTCWSYGGYIAHYMINRHPERFSCLVAKQSNFSEEILDVRAVSRYRDRKVAIFFTENDLKICRTESQAAARWYNRHGFDVQFAVFQNLGHERTPSLAASFFARTCNATPKTPPVELARLQVKELPPGRTVAVAGAAAPGPRLPIRSTGRPSQAGPAAPARHGDQHGGAGGFDTERPLPTSGQPTNRLGRSAAGDARVTDRSAVPLRIRPVTPQPNANRTTPRREVPAVRDRDTEGPVRVRVSSTIGISPLLVSYSATLPARLQRSAFFLWTDNGEPISNGINGQKFFTEPGVHRLGVLVTTQDGREYRAAQKITVLERIGKDDANN